MDLYESASGEWEKGKEETEGEGRESEEEKDQCLHRPH